MSAEPHKDKRDEERESMITFLGHPACTTCKKAEKWLKEQDIPYTWKDIREYPPERALLESLLEEGVFTPRRLFNTSGTLYQEQNLKNRLDELSTEEKVDMLHENGMLIRRPFITDGEKVTVGFDEESFAATWNGKDRKEDGK